MPEGLGDRGFACTAERRFPQQPLPAGMEFL